MSTAYWGPEIRWGNPQPALSINFDAHTNVESLSFKFNSDKASLPIVYIQEQNSRDGIDYIEIVNEAQTELELRFLHPLPGETNGIPDAAPALTADNIRILGGERIRNIRVLGVAATGDVLTVTVDVPGDFSYYALALVAGDDIDDPPAGFDPRLSRVRFSFKAACPSEFDCRTALTCANEPPPSPRIDYLARDYQSFRRVLLDRLRLLMPNWTETSGADFPIAIAELLAYVGDQIYLAPRQAPLDSSTYSPILSEAGLTFREGLPNPVTTPAARCITQTPAAAHPQAWLDSDGERWTAVGDLLGSDGDAAEFVVEIDNRRRAHLRFGDNEHGRRPSLGQSFTAVFRTGNGSRGNIGPEAISAILRPGGGVRRVRNPLPAKAAPSRSRWKR